MKKKLNRLALLPLAALCMAAPLAHAQFFPEPQPDPTGAGGLKLRAGVGLEHDSNVTRASSGGQSDQAGVLSLGGRYEKRISLQQIVVDAEATTYRFRDNSGFNYSTLNYNAAWNFQVTPRVKGTVGASQAQYRDYTEATAGVFQTFRRTERREVAEATYTTGMGWLGQVGLDHSRNRSDNRRTLDGSPEVTSLRLGVGREFASGAQIVGQYRHGDGEYDNNVAGNDFKEKEYGVRVFLPATARTRLDGSIGHLSRDHDASPSRDFSGMVARFQASYELSPKTRVSAGVSRNLGSYEFAGGCHVTSNRFFVEPVWKPTEKTALRFRWTNEKREWDTTSPAAPDAGRSDKSNFLSAGFEWEPVQRLLVITQYRHERRNSNINAFDYRANVFSVGARYTFL